MELNIPFLFFSLFAAEQIIMVKLGSYPYFWGIPFARRALPNNLKIEDAGGFIGRLRIKKDEEGNIFFRYKHFPLTWGPYVFVGQVRKEDPTELIIRLGPLTCLFFIAFILQGFISGMQSTIVSLVTVGFFLWYFFYSCLKGYEKIISRNQTLSI
jgi:hypothetical protein